MREKPEKAKKSDIAEDAKSDIEDDVTDKTAEDIKADEPSGETVGETTPETEAEIAKAFEKPAEVEKSSEGSPNRFKRFWQGYWRRKKWTIPLTVLLLVGIILAVPQTRYPVLALGLKRDATVFIVDESTNKPVASAKVIIDGQTTETNNNGSATVKARVGKRAVQVSKKYYSDANGEVFVNAFMQPSDRPTIKIKATGRQVPVMVSNKLTGKLIENALVKAAGTEARTSKIGEAILVVPADKAKIPIEISFEGFNNTKAEMVVSETAVPENGFQLTPNGKVYFLSKKSGKIDVVKTNLDGTDRQTVVAGTGQEEDRNTIMLASRDWRYLAFQSRRDSKLPKLYLIDTSNDKMTTMDEGDASFGLTGWSDNSFVYTVYRNAVKDWQPGKSVLKSFDAKSGKISVLDQSEAIGDQAGFASQRFDSIYLFGDRAVYGVAWEGYINSPAYNMATKSVAIRSVSLNGQNKKDLKTFPADKHSMNGARLYKPREVYYAVSSSTANGSEFYEYESGVVKPVKLDSNDYYDKAYPTYLVSPSGKRVFWSEERDGRATFFTGNLDAEDSKELRTLEDYQVYGWYSDDYLITSKKGSELYIMPVENTENAPVTKITDYHKPSTSYRGYGGGYGGL